MLNIGGIKLQSPFIQAPLSGYSDRPMRVLAREFGCPLTFTGVVLDKAVAHPKAVKKMLLPLYDDEHPIGAQILGGNPETMANAARVIEQIGYDLVDLNFACPVPKVLRRGRGGFLLSQPSRLMEIYRRVRENVKIPVLMKLRVGFDYSEIQQENFWQICDQACAEGVDALVIHGRTVAQRYRKKANWSIIARAKKRFPDTPIIGSGDLLNAEIAVERLTENSLDGVIIARGAIGNPWIFAEADAVFKGQPKPPPPDIAQQKDIITRHFNMLNDAMAPFKAVRYFRKFAAKYCKRHPERKKVLIDFMKAKKREEVLDTIDKWYN